MTNVASSTASLPVDASQLLRQTLFAPVQDELEQVETLLRTELRSDYPYVDELVRYGCLLGGKRLRPALLLVTAKAAGVVGPEHLTLATVVEMIHTATLVHDDVIDEADLRRHLATVNARWDNEASVLLGDFLFTHAFYLASTLPTTLACRLIGQATNIVCEGELRQKGSRGHFSLTESEYYSIIEAKTAELCAVSCRLGAHYAGASDDLAVDLGEYGRELGIAFQIADDLLDVQGDERETGKSLGTDLAKQKPTLPVIHVLQHVAGRDREDVLSALNGEVPRPLDVLAPYFERFDSFEYTRTRAAEFAGRARARLDRLPPTPARESLRLMTEFVVARSH